MWIKKYRACHINDVHCLTLLLRYMQKALKSFDLKAFFVDPIISKVHSYCL